MVCMDAPRSTRFQPCQHAACCADCAQVLFESTRNCPLCSSRIDVVGSMGASSATFRLPVRPVAADCEFETQDEAIEDTPEWRASLKVRAVFADFSFVLPEHACLTLFPCSWLWVRAPFHRYVRFIAYNKHPSDNIGSLSVDFAFNVWRVQVGSYCDAQDQYKVWYESKVVEDKGKVLRVHFMGWEPRWDIDLERSSPKLQPHHAMVPNWRVFRANDRFEMRGSDGKWHLATVEKVDRESMYVQLRPVVLKTYHDMGTRCFGFMRCVDVWAVWLYLRCLWRVHVVDVPVI